MPSESGNTQMFMHGLTPKPELSCPGLDPDAAIQIPDSLIRVYQQNIDALINQLGKDVYLNFDPTKTECPNCIFDPIRERSSGRPKAGGPRPFRRGRQCPYCKARGFIEEQNQKCIKCLIKWNPKDLQDYDISLRDEVDVVRFKTYLTNYDDIVRAKTALSNVAQSEQFRVKVRKIKGPTPVGLREDRYCVSFWEVMDT